MDSANERVTGTYPFRVFISYTHEDKTLIQQVDAILRENGLVPVWDQDIRPGKYFTDEIKRQIATAHVFMPLITAHSRTRPWVHQEIGFANGIDIPVLAIALDTLPEGMIAGIQALDLHGDLSALSHRLKEARIDGLVLPVDHQSELQRLAVSSEVADFPEQRTELLLRHARGIPGPARVRQRAMFSSFSLPSGGPDDPQWAPMRHGAYGSDYFRDLLSQERRVLEGHAREGGCSLILHPFVSPGGAESGLHRAQLALLSAFLDSMPAEKFTVAISETGIAGNLTLIGDWMLAAVVPPQPGRHYRGTFFTRHAPTVLRRLSEFDAELKMHLDRSGTPAHGSRDVAISRIQDMLRSLPAE